MYGRGHENDIIIDVSDDNYHVLYKEIRQKLSRKFGMNILDNKKNRDNTIYLYENGITVDKIAEILSLRKNNVDKIIEEYKSKKNST